MIKLLGLEVKEDKSDCGYHYLVQNENSGLKRDSSNSSPEWTLQQQNFNRKTWWRILILKWSNRIGVHHPKLPFHFDI